ncbi:CPT2 [Cordylochernes scorpioides]|uniref:CPT2 n=1 Tax=Cordylochernes scorpioides TaxID=51811 RepID=A0ABY6KLT7_9ARAC|nr:CPT2 [Cordylochernes scorpioides]
MGYACSQDPVDYQYLQKSKVPTYHFQKSLPRLPIPELELSCSRYLEALKPLLTEAQMKETSHLVDNFKATEGKILHQDLVKKDKQNKHTSYISGPWFEMYLKSRVPLVLNFNPALVWKTDPDPQYNDQLTRATNMAVSILRFYRSLKEEVLEPDVYHLNPSKSDTPAFRRFVRMLPSAISWYGAYFYKAFPLDMSQFRNLFFSTRIPRTSKDELVTYPDAKHLAVLRNGHFYVFDVLDKNGSILPASHIHGCLQTVMSDQTPPPSHPISVLTTENRDVWAKYRAILEKDNPEALRLVDSAMYCMVLDDAHGQDLIKAAHLMLHGPGHNRWFDKCFQLIICKEGDACINFEHSWGDGVAVLRLFNEVYEDSTKNHFVSPSSKPAAVDPAAVRRLDFQLDQTVKEGIEAASRHYQKNTGDLDLTPLIYEGMNRESLKKSKLSPDSVMQLSFQLTRATNMAVSILRFYRSLKEEVLEPDVYHLNPNKSDTPAFRRFVRMLPSAISWYGAYFYKAFPLDMSQFRNLFFSTRIPRTSKDELVTYPDAKHLAVLRNGHFYVFDVLDKNGSILPASYIHGCLQTVMSDQTPPPSHPISVLTTENRDVWAKYRAILEKDNPEALRLVDSAMYCMVLDDAHGQDLIKAAHLMLHGPGHNRSMGYYKLHGKIPPTYESCSTAAFKHGRTETLRPTTVMTKTAIEKFESGQATAAEILPLLKACSDRHNQLTKEAAMGQGFDRHLFALKHLAESKGQPTPEIFKDPNYAYANHYYLSSSTLFGNAFKAGGFGPVVSDGFGLAYSVTDENLRILASSYRSHTSGADLIKAIEAMLRLFNEVYEDSTKNHFVSPSSKPAAVDPAAVRRLDFQLDQTVKEGIEAASRHYQKNTGDLDLTPLIYEGMNRESLKKSKLSPDSVMQLSFQMGYYKLHGKIPPTYESCSTAAFKHGRTETLRPTTVMTKTAIEKFESGQATAAEILPQLKACSDRHNQLTKEAAMGQGFDRHLFALKHLAESKGHPTPEIFKDPNYAYANHYYLSSSTLFGNAFKAGGFGPVVSDGFGLAYSVTDENLRILASSYRSHTSGADLIKAIEASLNQIQKVLRSQ